ncbi:Flp pilus assembly protein CpaB [Salipiger pallidus]|uniref:Flp pilus assembly protein CpaB n=1 Tax=Salipiger pallidus TaxID=1775170 RepID=A0A8J2ZMA0_9RHOB|nr:Flp pilus assembly protein CpaB [Salipiger pallidus]GGG82228.1 Flp pilus assembly protein CpaB [Salipiger pallidus]
MRLVFGLVLIAGIGLAGLAVHMAQQQIGAYEAALDQERQKAVTAIPTTMVYVTAKPIPHGETIKREDVKLAPWPTEILPENAFTEANPFFEDGKPLRVSLRALDQFEALIPGRVSEPGGDAGLITTRLKRGERAFAIKVDVASGVSGFLRPGDRVDVYWTGRMPGNDPNLPQGDVTKLIESGVRLIAVDQTAIASSDATIARTVTVAISPQQVAGLAQAQSTGRLSLSLLAANDDTVADAIEVSQRDLLGIVAQQQQEAVVQVTPEVCSTRVRRGAEVVDIPIPCTN